MDLNQRQIFWEVLCAANRPEDAQKINATIKLPEHLYRYRAPNMNSLSALMDNRCYFSTSNYYDDPFDTFLHIDFGLIDRYVTQFFEHPKQIIESVVNGQSVSDDAINYMNSVGSAEISRRMRLIFKDIRSELRKQVFSICFSQTPTNESLWQKYAANYSGFVIEYDPNVPCTIMSTSEIEQKYTVPSLTLSLYPMYYSNTKYDATEYARDLVVQKIIAVTCPQFSPFVPKILPPHYWERERITLIKKARHSPDEEWRMLLGSPYLINASVYLQWKPSRIILGLRMDETAKRLAIEAAKIAKIPRISQSYINDSDDLDDFDISF